MEITELEIDCAKWTRGNLLDGEGAMCVMGFIGKACGVSNRDLLRNSSALNNNLYPAKVRNMEDQLVAANDQMAGKARKKKLKSLLKKCGIVVTFINE